MHYRFGRDPGGSLAYEVRSWVRTDFGALKAAAILDGGKRLAVGKLAARSVSSFSTRRSRAPIAKITTPRP